MIQEIHRKLVEGVRGGRADPGNYRRIQNYVANAATGEVIYTPPSAVEVPVMMSEMVKWLNADLPIHSGTYRRHLGGPVVGAMVIICCANHLYASRQGNRY
jgi:hypothetical protein